MFLSWSAELHFKQELVKFLEESHQVTSKKSAEDGKISKRVVEMMKEDYQSAK